MKTILLIDDDENVRVICHEILAQEGYRVLKAEHGKAGMKLLDGDTVHAVITDIVMPEQEGIETIMLLRKTYPAIKIIAMSGGGTHVGSGAYLSIAQAVGAHATLQKPFEKEELLSALRNALEVP